MSEQPTNTPHATAAMLAITPVTLRRWCEYHAEHLSDGANPLAGKARRFTGRDLEVFKHVRSLRAQGLTVSDINEQLQSLTFAIVDTDEQSAPNGHPDSEELAPLASQEAPQSTQAIIMVVESLRSEVKAIQEARRFDAVGLVGLGIVIGLVFATMFIALASLYGG